MFVVSIGTLLTNKIHLIHIQLTISSIINKCTKMDSSLCFCLIQTKAQNSPFHMIFTGFYFFPFQDMSRLILILHVLGQLCHHNIVQDWPNKPLSLSYIFVKLPSDAFGLTGTCKMKSPLFQHTVSHELWGKDNQVGLHFPESYMNYRKLQF